MSEPIRSASASPFAATRPQVHSRRVSVRVGPFGLTYSTDRLLWDPDAPPVDSAQAVTPQPLPSAPAEERSFPLDLDTARQQALWLAAQQQAQQQQAQAQAQARADADAPSPAPVAGVQAQPEPTQGDASTGTSANGAFGAWTGGGGDSQGNQTRGATLRQAMRQATQAYLACARSFACPRPMLQAVA